MGIVVKNLKKSFEDFNIDVDLTINKGELITLLGPSGCGKTTLIQLISGILTPDSGDVFINSKNVSRLPIWQRDIGIVFQDYALFPHMNVKSNIAYGLKARKKENNLIKRKVSEMLELVHLSGYGERNIESLSGGEKQRTALARALAPSPELLLLDEPLSALDARLRTILKREIRSIQQELGITTIYVTHDQEEALSISDRIVLMSNGRIEQIGTPWDIYNHPSTDFSADFLGDSNKIQCIVEDVSKTEGIYLQSVEPGQTVRLPFRLSYREEIRKGERYLLFFRPQDTKIIWNSKKDVKDNTINGQILSTEYFGKYLTVEYKWGNTLLKTEITGWDNKDSEALVNDGNISVAVDPGKCWLIRD